MSVFVIALLRFTDEPSYRRYQNAFPAVLRKFDAKVLVADESPVVIEGASSAPSKVVVLEFASAAEARRFTSDPDYEAISKDRRKGADTLSLLVQGSHR